MDKYYRTISVIILAVLMIGAALIFAPIKNPHVGEEFKIEDNENLRNIAGSLAAQDLILNRYLFTAYVILSGNEKKLKAGRYLLPSRVSIKKLTDIFSGGLAESNDIYVTIPEGSNIGEIDRALAKSGLAKSGALLKPDIVITEGYLFPDTYRLDRLSVPDEAAVELIQKMKENFDLKTKGLFGRLSAQKIKDAMIVASMLEKEVKTEPEMRLVAGIINKRMESGMPLEIDATVAYGVCRGLFLSGRPCDVSKVNLVDNIPLDSAYNTYRNKGLPAGPISNPGIKAIGAALNPQPSDYLFYLTTRDGVTIFSKTAAEHNQARQKYIISN